MICCGMLCLDRKSESYGMVNDLVWNTHLVNDDCFAIIADYDCCFDGDSLNCDATLSCDNDCY